MARRRKANEAFDPEGDDYDQESAEEEGLEPDETQHWPSRVPSGKEEGLQLKGHRHPTAHMSRKADEDLGYELYQEDRGFGKGVRYYSRKRNRLRGH